MRFVRTFVLAFLLCTILAVHAVHGQVTTGTPPFGSFSGTPDIVNLGNNNAHLVIPVIHKPGRGTNFTYDLSFDTSIWYPSTLSGTNTWTPVAGWGWRGVTEVSTGYLSYATVSQRCFEETRWVTYHVHENYVYHDAVGIPHYFAGSTEDGIYNCETGEPSFTALAQDASGYTLNASYSGASTITTSTGTVFRPPQNSGNAGGSFTDRNGNEITNANGVFTDTLGSTVLTVTGSGTPTSPYVFAYTAPSGSAASYTMKFTAYTVKTNFGCTGVTDYPATSTNLVSEIDLPDGSKYTFNYEQTPSFPGDSTGRLASVTLPTGGTISYTYTGGNNGAVCSDGSTPILTRTTPDGTWTYTRTQISGNHWQTKMTTPPDPTNSGSVGDDTVIDFQEDIGGTYNFYETQRVSYQGASSSNVILQTNTTCYNTNTTSCTTTSVTSPITQRNVVSSLPTPGSGTVQSQSITKYNSVGVPTEIDDYAFGAGSVGGLLQQTLITYASLGNITAFRQIVTVKNGGGTVLAQTNFNYDQTTPGAAPSGTPQLTSPPGSSRGNLTSVQRCLNLSNCSTYLQTTMTYDTAGQLQTVKDPLSNQTSFSYSDNFLDDDGSNPPSKAHAALGYPTDAYVTSITPPLNGAITLKYYYYNGATALTTDQNNNSSWSHFDSIGRPSSTYGPTVPIAGTQNNANPWTLINYTTTTQVDTYTDINDSSTTATNSCSVCRHDEAVSDGLGRAINVYLKSDPEGTTEVDTAYDALGRTKTGSHPYRSTNDTTYGIETPTYDALGRTIKITHPDNTYSQAAFGASVSGTGVNTSQLCNVAGYGIGYPSLLTDEAGKRREVWSDALGRTIEADEPDATGALTSNTCYFYDALGNLLQIVHGSQLRTYGYDTLSRVTSVTIPELGGCAMTYGYDNNSNVQTRTAPAPNQTSCATTVTTTYYHDALNRLTKITYGATTPVATPTVQYAYDNNTLSGCATTPPALTDSNPKGSMTSMCDGSGATSWAHDAAGRIITEKRTVQGTSAATQTTSYSYNLDSSIATVTYPSGKIVTYTVSNAQRLTAAEDAANSVQFATAASYSAPGGLNGVITGQISGGFAGISETHNYNNSLEYTSTKATSTAGTAIDLSVNYASSGDNGSITSITNNADSGRTQTLTYDPLNRVLSVESSATSGADCWGQVFGPNGTAADDALGNFTNVNSGTQTQPPCQFGMLTVSVDGNNHITTSGFGYDAAGNTLQDGSGSGYSYSFDAENRLVQATGMSGGPYCYVYDGNGLRVAKKSGANSDCTGGTVTKLYWRSLSGDALAETDGSGSTTNAAYAEYVFFAGRRIASRVGPSNASSSIFYYFADQLGSIRTVTTGGGSGQTPGQLCYDADFTPYGQEISYTSRLQTTACPPNYKFTGYERDPETGLDYAFARYYSSRLGRFLSTDPLGGSIGSLQSHNAYAYVVNNPMNAIDPLGLCGRNPNNAHVVTPCADPDNPYPTTGGGGGCGLDCAGGAGFAGELGGGGYAGNCPPEFQSCVNNGSGGFLGLAGSNAAYNCDAPNAVESSADCDDDATLFLFLGTPASGANPCPPASPLSFDYKTPRPYGTGPESPIDHITNNHILPSPGKSQYIFQSNVVGLADKQSLVVKLNAAVFTLGTWTIQPNTNIAYTFTFPPVPNPKGATVYSGVGTDVNNGGAITNTATLILEKNCSTVVTSFPGEPGGKKPQP